MMGKNIAEFVLIDPEEADALAQYLIFNRHMDKKLVEDIFQNSPLGVATSKSEKFQRTVERLDVLFEEDTSVTDAVIESHFLSLASIEPDEIDSIEDFILNTREVNPKKFKAMAKKHPAGFIAGREKLEHVSDHMDDFFAQNED